MLIIKYEFVDRTSSEAEITEKFYLQFLPVKKKYDSIERKETRRHQSLFSRDYPDKTANAEKEIEFKETKIEIHNAIKLLTEKQRIILISYAIYKYSFREIGDKLGIHKDTVREHYLAAIKKMKKYL